jgi:hypothetical protein
MSLRNPKASPNIIYLGTLASKWKGPDSLYFPDYLKIPNGLLIYKRDEKIEIDPDG